MGYFHWHWVSITFSSVNLLALLRRLLNLVMVFGDEVDAVVLAVDLNLVELPSELLGFICEPLSALPWRLN